MTGRATDSEGIVTPSGPVPLPSREDSAPGHHLLWARCRRAHHIDGVRLRESQRGRKGRGVCVTVGSGRVCWSCQFRPGRAEPVQHPLTPRGAVLLLSPELRPFSSKVTAGPPCLADAWVQAPWPWPPPQEASEKPGPRSLILAAPVGQSRCPLPGPQVWGHPRAPMPPPGATATGTTGAQGREGGVWTWQGQHRALGLQDPEMTQMGACGDPREKPDRRHSPRWSLRRTGSPSSLLKMGWGLLPLLLAFFSWCWS